MSNCPRILISFFTSCELLYLLKLLKQFLYNVCLFSDAIDKVGPLWEEMKDFMDVVFVPYGKSEVPSNT